MKKHRNTATGPHSLSDSDLLSQWAAEEFVAAGRAEEVQERERHRQRALFFRDVFQGLSRSPQSVPLSWDEPSDMGKLLSVAFRDPTAQRAPSKKAR